MSFLERIRGSRRADSPAGGSSETDSSGADVAIPGYAKLNERQAIAALGPLNQAELTAIERFERTHRGRVPVLDKLRYLREPEPLPDYDALEPSAIGAALAGGDADRVNAVRDYERKHQNRPTVNTEVVSALRSLRDRSNGTNGAAAEEPEHALVQGNGLRIKVEPERGLGTP